MPLVSLLAGTTCMCKQQQEHHQQQHALILACTAKNCPKHQVHLRTLQQEPCTTPLASPSHAQHACTSKPRPAS
jgi:hypothetical protein